MTFRKPPSPYRRLAGRHDDGDDDDDDVLWRRVRTGSLTRLRVCAWVRAIKATGTCACARVNAAGGSSVLRARALTPGSTNSLHRSNGHPRTRGPPLPHRLYIIHQHNISRRRHSSTSQNAKWYPREKTLCIFFFRSYCYCCNLSYLCVYLQRFRPRSPTRVSAIERNTRSVRHSRGPYTYLYL